MIHQSSLATHSYSHSGLPDPSHPFLTTTPDRKTVYISSLKQESQNRNKRSYERIRGSGEREDLNSDLEYDDEMAELSDSYSSIHTTSRPVTPAHADTDAIQIASSQNGPSARSRSGSKSTYTSHSHNSPKSMSLSIPHPQSNEPFSLAHKAERILGLTPGTLAHATAALENAKDEIRRTANTPSPSPEPEPLDINATGNSSGGKGMVERMQTRARKAMSVAGLSSQTKVPGVVLGAGGKEEEERRERRRRAADGVIYWQREVARLEAEQAQVQAQRVGTTKRR